MRERYSKLDLCRDVYKGLKKPKVDPIPKEQVWLIKRDMKRPIDKRK